MGRHAALQISDTHVPTMPAELGRMCRATGREHLTVVPRLVGRHRRPDDDEDGDPAHQPPHPEPARAPATPARAGGTGLGWPGSSSTGRTPGSAPDRGPSAPLGWPALPWTTAVPSVPEPHAASTWAPRTIEARELGTIEQSGWRRVAGRLRRERNHGVVAVAVLVSCVSCLAAAVAVRGLTTLRR